MGRLAGKVAIITGASIGLGPVMAKAFVREGARVLIAARSEDKVKQVAADIGGGTVAVRADVGVEADVVAMVDAAMQAFGQVDVLVNNAAVMGKDLHVWEQTLENWNSTIAVDLTAAMLGTREVLNRSMMQRKTGVIINVGSISGWMNMPRKSHYASAKAALRAFTKTVANEVGPMGIRCNCLIPGLIETDGYKAWVQRIADEQGISYDEQYARNAQALPLRTISSREDVTNLALFLASDESRTITGQSINVDAGAVMVG